MRFGSAALYLAVVAASMLGYNGADAQGGDMVKMCLFYPNPSGTVRSDPIIDRTCQSGHVHTFYGPQNIHPDTGYEDIRDTPPAYSSSPFVENQSLYWHPTIYEVVENGDGTKTYTRAPNIETSYVQLLWFRPPLRIAVSTSVVLTSMLLVPRLHRPYYRWDNGPLVEPKTEAFP